MFGMKSCAKLTTALMLSSNSQQFCRSLSFFRPVLISIEGNIGSGKSTIIEALKVQHPEWNYVDEPVGIWTSLKNDAGTNESTTLHAVNVVNLWYLVLYH